MTAVVKAGNPHTRASARAHTQGLTALTLPRYRDSLCARSRPRMSVENKEGMQMAGRERRNSHARFPERAHGPLCVLRCVHSPALPALCAGLSSVAQAIRRLEGGTDSLPGVLLSCECVVIRCECVCVCARAVFDHRTHAVRSFAGLFI